MAGLTPLSVELLSLPTPQGARASSSTGCRALAERWSAKILGNETVQTRRLCGRSTMYSVEVSNGRGCTWTIRRRYRDFHLFFRRIVAAVPDLLTAGPPFPRKRLLNRLEPAFVSRRQFELQVFLSHVLQLHNSEHQCAPAVLNSASFVTDSTSYTSLQQCSRVFFELDRAKTIPSCTVAVSNMGGESLVMQEWPTTMTLAAVKERIGAQWGVAPALQRLLSNGRCSRELSASEPLADIVEGGRVDLTLVKVPGSLIIARREPPESGTGTCEADRFLRRREPLLENGLGVYHECSDSSTAYRQVDSTSEEHVLSWTGSRWKLVRSKTGTVVMYSAPGVIDQVAGPAAVKQWVLNMMWDPLDQAPCRPSAVDVEVRWA